MSSAPLQAANAPPATGGDDIDPCSLSASELAGLIARGAITAREAVEAYIARIEQVNGALNAVVVKRSDEARGTLGRRPRACASTDQRRSRHRYACDRSAR
jgi:Asp-tRNA(Asn)/Glu-tRNA(Gln) amidotransferase A subunit family amidase